MADPNLTKRRSYNQSKCLYLWFTDRLVFCKIREKRTKHYGCQVLKRRTRAVAASFRAGTHGRCQLILNVALQTVHFGTFPGICYHTVKSRGRVNPHWAIISNLNNDPGQVNSVFSWENGNTIAVRQGTIPFRTAVLWQKGGLVCRSQTLYLQKHSCSEEPIHLFHVGILSHSG